MDNVAIEASRKSSISTNIYMHKFIILQIIHDAWYIWHDTLYSVYIPLNKMSIYLGIVAKAWNSRLWARGAADLCGPGCHQKGLSTELLTFCVLPSNTPGPPPPPPRAIVNFELQKRRPKNHHISKCYKTRKIWKSMPNGSQCPGIVFFWILANLDFCNTLQRFCYILKIPGR